MGVVYYANYLIWMEVGRAEYCRAAGIRYRDMELEDGILLAVVEAHCRYLRPARYDEEIVVKTRVATRIAALLNFNTKFAMRRAEPTRGRRDEARLLRRGNETGEASGEILAVVRNRVGYLNSIFDSPVNL